MFVIKHHCVPPPTIGRQLYPFGACAYLHSSLTINSNCIVYPRFRRFSSLVVGNEKKNRHPEGWKGAHNYLAPALLRSLLRSQRKTIQSATPTISPRFNTTTAFFGCLRTPALFTAISITRPPVNPMPEVSPSGLPASHPLQPYRPRNP